MNNLTVLKAFSLTSLTRYIKNLTCFYILCYPQRFFFFFCGCVLRTLMLTFNCHLGRRNITHKSIKEKYTNIAQTLKSVTLCFYFRDSLLLKYFDDLMISCLYFFSLNPWDYYQKSKKHPTTMLSASNDDNEGKTTQHKMTKNLVKFFLQLVLCCLLQQNARQAESHKMKLSLLFFEALELHHCSPFLRPK